MFIIIKKNLINTLSIISGSGVWRRVTIRLIIGSGVGSLMISTRLRGGDTLQVELGSGCVGVRFLYDFDSLWFVIEGSGRLFAFLIIDDCLLHALFTTTLMRLYNKYIA